MLTLNWTPESVPVMKEAMCTLADIKDEHTREQIEDAVVMLSRLDLLDVLVDEAVKYVREEFLTDTDPSYDVILTEVLVRHGRENSIEAMETAGVSRSVYFERKADLLTALGLALTCYSAKAAVTALGEW